MDVKARSIWTIPAAFTPEGVDQFSRRGKSSEVEWETFAPFLNYLSGGFHRFEILRPALWPAPGCWIKDWGVNAKYIFYQATPPAIVEPSSINWSGRN